MNINPKIAKLLKDSDEKGIEGVSVFENETKSVLQSLAIQHLAGKLNNNDTAKKNKRRHHQQRLLSA